MDMKSIAQQTIGFNKACIDNGFAAMILAQEQMVVMTETFFNQISGFPAEGKKAIEDWIKAYQNGCDVFKKALFDTIEQIENLIKV